MNELRISLFGRMRIVSVQDLMEIHLTPSVEILLAYLVLRHGRTVSREKLISLFWREIDQQHAHDCLNTALWRLRSTFRQGRPNVDGAQYLVTNGLGEVGFNSTNNCWLDVVEFEKLWERTRQHSRDLSPQELADLNQIVALYDGDLLEGFDNDWLLSERERLRLIYLSSLAKLMDYYHLNKQPERSLEYGQRILAIDPLREDIHREMMRFFIELGQRTMAIHQYRICYGILSKELNIAPMIETRSLYEKVLADSESPISLASPVTSIPGNISEEYTNVLMRVEHAMTSFEQARDDLAQTIQALQRYSAVHKASK